MKGAHSTYEIVDIEKEKPTYKVTVIVFHPENNEPIFAKLFNTTEDEKGLHYYWKRGDNNEGLSFEPKYWTDAPVFDPKLIKRD